MEKNKASRINRHDFLSLAATSLVAAKTSARASSQEARDPRAPQKHFRIVDTHLHTFNSKLQGAHGIPYYDPESTIEYELSLMDRGGVDKAFLISYNSEDIAVENRYRGMSPVTMLPVINKEYQVKSWQAHKDRFWWFTDHVNPLHEHYLEDLEHDFELGASGVKLLPMFHGLLPDNPAWIPVYDLCLRRRKPIIIDWSWWYLGGEVGWGMNESRERQELCKSYRSYADWVKPMDPIFDQFTALPISLAHCGTPKTRDDYEHIFAFIARHPNCHCDLAAIPDYNPWFIEQLVKAVGPRKVMYGTDAPYWFTGKDSYMLGSRRWGVVGEDCYFLNDAEKQLILAGNAERFVKFAM